MSKVWKFRIDILEYSVVGCIKTIGKVLESLVNSVCGGEFLKTVKLATDILEPSSIVSGHCLTSPMI
jgi:hypothetical protein